MPRSCATLLTSIALAACAGRGGGPSDPAPPPPAPWSADTLAVGEVPEVLVREWRQAENRETCAPLAPGTVEPEVADPRAATFGSGWGMAWDLPDQRSAFGVAGTGVEPSGTTYDEWPHELRWADGSTAGYGPEGGTGPNQLAYLRIPGQSCLYNVWSRLGIEHLEALLASLRWVEIRER